MEGAATDADRPGPQVADPGDRLGELPLTVPRDAGDAQDLPLADRERDVPHRGLAPVARNGQPFDLERSDVRELPRLLARP